MIMTKLIIIFINNNLGSWHDFSAWEVMRNGRIESATFLIIYPLCCSAFPNLTEPSLYFGEPEYVVDESSGYVEVKVWRTGTDLSKTATVTIRSRKSEPVSAEGKISSLREST